MRVVLIEHWSGAHASLNRVIIAPYSGLASMPRRYITTNGVLLIKIWSFSLKKILTKMLPAENPFLGLNVSNAITISYSCRQ